MAEYAELNIDYHAAVDYHFYSVPYHLVHREVDVPSTALTVELSHQAKRGACCRSGLFQKATWIVVITAEVGQSAAAGLGPPHRWELRRNLINPSRVHEPTPPCSLSRHTVF